MAIVALKACAALLVLLVPRVSKEKRELKGALVPVDSRAFRAPRVTLATVGRKVLVAAVLPAHKVPKEFKVQRAAEVLLVQGLVARLDLWDLVGSVVRWASKVKRATPALLVPRVLVDVMV